MREAADRVRFSLGVVEAFLGWIVSRSLQFRAVRRRRAESALFVGLSGPRAAGRMSSHTRGNGGERACCAGRRLVRTYFGPMPRPRKLRIGAAVRPASRAALVAHQAGGSVSLPHQNTLEGG
jgi:hypothetical protein